MKRNSPRSAAFAADDSSAVSAPARTVAELAGLRRRLASMLYESLLLLGVLALTFLVPYLVLGAGLGIAPPAGGFMWLHIFVVLGGYFVWYWRHNGQTLAMQTWKLKLVRADGRALSLARCCMRYALAWPSVLLCGVGLLWALIDRDRQFLHDRLTGSCVVLLPVASAR